MARPAGLELVGPGHLADREQVAGGCADRLKCMNGCVLGAVAGAEDLDDPLVVLEVEGLALEERRAPRDEELLGPAELIAELVEGSLEGRANKLRFVHPGIGEEVGP